MAIDDVPIWTLAGHLLERRIDPAVLSTIGKLGLDTLFPFPGPLQVSASSSCRSLFGQAIAAAAITSPIDGLDDGRDTSLRRVTVVGSCRSECG